ncbi:uncharacterized protein LOC113229374 isoform X2 [Hyposmocoma kahamanoa]|uniref:uncharacterized protein LOC113229374 isoform X2 n=1 Tax=Hyposmocoma kahamanoa TaxID=1477025 RepID=UPI000E6D5C7A|nr:uncharacterized protein LOC113229374 isoform X2 [Hyposmocoma kahamanoa]
MKKRNILTVILLLVYYDTFDAFVPEDDFLQQSNRPESCYGTDEVMDAKCCLFPPFFVREIARECGALFSLQHRSVEHNITTFRREAMTVGMPKEEAKSLTKLLSIVQIC